jgi:hypothetical protein
MGDAIMSAVIARRDRLRTEFSANNSKELWDDIRACETLISKLRPSSLPQFPTEMLSGPLLELQRRITYLGQLASVPAGPVAGLN